MNTDLETIENYVTGQLTAEERLRFETALRTDPAVADALTFYMQAKYVAQAEARAKRKLELDALRTPDVPSRLLWSVPMRWAAAASIVLLLGLGWYFFQPADNAALASQIADTYTKAHFTQLPTTMDGASSGSASVDSLKMGIGLFNKEKLAEAEGVFQDVLTHHSDMESALKYAGIVAYQQGNYEKAIDLFHRLSQRGDLVANLGTFYEALALLKRGQATDKEQAKALLERVISKNLEGKRDAERLVEKL